MEWKYAELSIVAGFMAAGADEHLGGDHFIQRARQHAWDLTQDMVDNWKSEAIQMGVPAENLELNEEQREMLPKLVLIGMGLQSTIDC